MEDIYFKSIYVVKRNGQKEIADFSKVDARLNYLNSRPYQLLVNASFVSQKVREQITDGISTKKLDEFASEIASNMGDINPEFQKLAARISISNHQKNTSDCFSGAVETCYRNRTIKNGVLGDPAPRVNAKFYKFVQIHKDTLNRMIDYQRDYDLSYFGFTTLLDKYLLKRSGAKEEIAERPQDFAIERPQDMWMRIACAIHMNRSDLEDTSVLSAVQETYDDLSLGRIMHATPTLYNMGTECEQALSCFILGGADSSESILRVITNSGIISKFSGGVGWWWDLRAGGTEVKKTNGTSGGPIPFGGIMERTALAFNQGGKRNGSFAWYLEPHHPDFMQWAKLKRKNEEGSLPGLFFATWASDMFMRCVEEDRMWYFFDVTVCPKLYNSYGAEYEQEYERAVEARLYTGEPVKARTVMLEICTTQSETGMPYMLYKDAINEKSNQKNIGIIKASNLCTEIMEVSTPDEYACCCVAAVCLPKFVRDCDCDTTVEVDGITETAHRMGCNGRRRFDFDALAARAAVLVRNLNKVIDINFYPVEETRASNLRHRPLAIGVQGLADVFAMLKYPFTSDCARELNKQIFESLYYGALRESCNLARVDGPYETFEGSPFSEGILQWHMWGLNESDLMGYWKWSELIEDIMTYGTRNSLLTSLPPTATTSQIQTNNEAYEPFTDNMYVRKTLSGEFTVINRHLIADLTELGLWNPSLKAELIRDRGSVQNLNIPQDVKELYRTVWELDGDMLLKMDAERAPFIDQSMSSNRWMKNPTAKKLMGLHHKAWKLKLKTGMYYLRTMSASKAKQFSEAAVMMKTKQNVKAPECTPECDSCSV